MRSSTPCTPSTGRNWANWKFQFGLNPRRLQCSRAARRGAARRVSHWPPDPDYRFGRSNNSGDAPRCRGPAGSYNDAKHPATRASRQTRARQIAGSDTYEGWERRTNGGTRARLLLSGVTGRTGRTGWREHRADVVISHRVPPTASPLCYCARAMVSYTDTPPPAAGFHLRVDHHEFFAIRIRAIRMIFCYQDESTPFTLFPVNYYAPSSSTNQSFFFLPVTPWI